MVVHLADSNIAVVLLDTDPYHAMTPLIKIALSQFSEGDQTNNISQELSEKLHKLGSCQKLLTTKSDLTQDDHLGFTMYWKYKANSVILLSSIESCPTTCLLF